MSIYYGKLLELVEIEKRSDKYFLHIKLSFQQVIEILWEIDGYTAENLKNITDFNGQYRYRLSFHTSWDPIQKQYTGILTRTYREQSKSMCFLCSKTYVNNLDAIKHIQNINALEAMSFISRQVSQNDELPEQQKESEPSLQKRYLRKFIWKAAAVMTFISAALFSYSSYAYLNKDTSSIDKVPTTTVILDQRVDIIQEEELNPNPLAASVPKVDNLIKPISSLTATIPSLEVKDQKIYSIPEGNVALTFDDGPSKYSVNIMDILKKYEVGGTFFFIGLNVKKYPDDVKYIHSQGYPIGSHSMNHPNLSTLSREKQESELVQSNKVLEDLINEKVILFRPPYGAMNKQLEDLLYSHQHKIILWNNDPEDWKTRDANKILAHIKNSDVSGSIIVLHESQAVIDALPGIIEYLQQQNLKIVSLQ